MIEQIKDIYKFRELLFALLIRGFKTKYKNSFLGIFWSLLNPLLNVAIFSFIFTVIIKIDIKNYPLYLLCAIFPWNFFNSALTNSVVSIFEDSHFVKNTPFPAEIIPIAVTIVNFINFIIDLAILVLFLFLLGKGLMINWLFIPLLLFTELILTCGLCVALAGIYIVFRDINFILNLFLRLFFYFTPVIYTLGFVPDKLRPIYLINPLAIIIDGFAKAFMGTGGIDLKLLLCALLESLFIFILCFGLFKRIKKIIPERL